MTTHLQKAFKLYNDKQFPKAVKLLIKIKSPCKDSLKLLMMAEYNSKNYVKAILAAKKLLKKTNDVTYVRDACNTIRICAQYIKDPIMELEYTEKSVRCDNSEKNIQAIYQLLVLYFLQKKFLKVEQLAEVLLQWKVCRAAVSFILIELAANQGNKEKLFERLQRAPEYFAEFNLKQLSIVIDFYIDTKLFQLAKTSLKYMVDKFGCDATSLQIALLFAQNDIEGAQKHWQQHKHLLQPHEAFYFAAKLARSHNNFSEEYLALSQAARAKKAADIQVNNHQNQDDIISLFDASLPKLAKVLPFHDDNFGNKQAFIMGFPRSGTTLLDNILDTQNDILVLSESSVITHLMEKFNTIKQYPLDIYKLAKNEIGLLRQRYFEHIQEQGLSLPQSNIIIEKDPHLTEAIPFLKTIFPCAKIIITLRHPLDVCMSCFQTHFKSNYNNDQLVTMEDIVTRYIKVFTLLERYQNELAIQPHFIRYEDLVTDIKGEMNKLFEFLEVTPNDDYLNFNKHAENKFVTSASRGQTNQPLYKSSINKWQNYQQHLAPHKEKLRYFIEKFGYEF